MKTLLLVRHAKSDWSDDGLSDFDRPLSERGRRDAPQMAAFLLGRGTVPELIVSSPAKRAYATARIFAERFEIPENDISVREELYEASAKTVREVIASLPEHVERAAVFAHNPALTYVVQQFADEYFENLTTAGVAIIEGEVDEWADLTPEAGATLASVFLPKAVLSRYK